MSSLSLEIIEERLIKKLVSKEEGSDLLKEIDINYTNQEGKSLLHFACEHKLENLCSTLVNINANVNISDRNGTTPLMIASRLGFSRIVDILLQAGADPNLVNFYGINLIPMSILVDDKEFFFKMLDIAESEFISIVGKIAVTSIAAALGKPDYVDILKKKFPQQLNCQVEKSGMTPLMLAVTNKCVQTVQSIIAAGCNVNLKNSYSMTALQIAISLDNEPIIRILSSVSLPNFSISPCTNNSSNLSFSNYEITTSNESHLMNNKSNISKNLRHPLTPNICVSPKQMCDIDKSLKPKGLFQLRSLRRRSRSAENKIKLKYNESENKDLLEYVLISAKLYDCWPLFKTHEISFNIFLTMNDEDLKSIGILKNSVRVKLLKVIKHNKRIFC